MKGLLTNMMLLNNQRKSNACMCIAIWRDVLPGYLLDVICYGNKSTPYHQRLVLVGGSGEFSPLMTMLKSSVRTRLD